MRSSWFIMLVTRYQIALDNCSNLKESFNRNHCSFKRLNKRSKGHCFYCCKIITV